MKLDKEFSANQIKFIFYFNEDEYKDFQNMKDLAKLMNYQFLLHKAKELDNNEDLIISSYIYEKINLAKEIIYQIELNIIYEK